MSNGPHNWALYYKADQGIPREFCEVRRVGNTVWVRSGKVETWGAGGPTEYDSPERADAEFRAECDRRAADGWALTRHGVYDPVCFDFELLRTEIRDGARRAWTAMRAAHPGETFIGFALVTDESAMTIGPMATSLEALQASGSDEADYRFNPGEWAYSEGGEYLDIAYRLLLPPQQGVPQDLPFAEFRDGVFEAAVAALEELTREGCFGTEADGAEVFLLLHVTDSDPLIEAVRRLNSPAMLARYQAWYDSWK